MLKYISEKAIIIIRFIAFFISEINLMHISNSNKFNLVLLLLERKKHENIMLKELESSGILDKLSPDATVITLTDSKLKTEEAHNYVRYFENFRRIVKKHSKQVNNYRNNYPNYKLIFFVFDESSGCYFETPKSTLKVPIQMGTNHGNIDIVLVKK